MPQRGSLIFLAVVLIALLPFLLQVAWPFLTSFILASILAIVMNPVKEWLSLRIHRPGLATFLTTFATVFVVGIVFAFAGFTITRELTAAYDALSRRSLEEGGWPTLVTHTADRVVDALATRLPVNKEAIRTELIDRMKDASGYLLNNVGAAVGGATTIFITGLLVTVFLYFLLRYGKDWIGRLAASDSARSSHHRQHSSDGKRLGHSERERRVRRRRGAGPSSWPGVLVCRRSVSRALGRGRRIGFHHSSGRRAHWSGFPSHIAFLLMGSYWKALLLGLWGSLVVGSVDNVLRPFVVGAREKQHPMLIALAAIGGTYAFGPLGILLGPLLVSLVAALLKEIQKLVSPGAVPATFPAGEGVAPPPSALDE